MVRTFKLTAHRPLPLDLDGSLNEQQRAVVTAAGGPMLVIAGAGTGKTRTLTWRLARLLHDGVDPGRILLMTFTNRAAREMLHRVELLAPHDAQRIWGGTFHHVANRMLRRDGERLGLAPDFTILDGEDAGDLIATCIVEAGVRIGRRRFPGKAVLRAMAGFVANTLEPLDCVLETRFPRFASLRPAIAKVLALYTERKRKHQLVDYDDLLAYWLRLLEEHADVRERVAEGFLHVLVDEFQDTNAIQGRIVDLIAARHRNVCVVGDDAQSIYSFRGASFANILRFHDRYPDAVEHRLEINYRSTPEILALANGSIAHNRQRLPKPLRAFAPADCARRSYRAVITSCSLASLPSTSCICSTRVVHSSMSPCSTAAIGTRWRSSSSFNGAMCRSRSGAVCVSSSRRTSRTCSASCVSSTTPAMSSRGVACCGSCRVSACLAARIWADVSATPDPRAAVRDVAAASWLPAAARESMTRFAAVMAALADVVAPGAMIETIVDAFYGDFLDSRYDNAELRRQDIRGVADFPGQYRSLEAFLTDVVLTGDFTGETCVDGPEEQEFVTLSTVHQAKGLEWPVVLIPWVADGRFPTDMAMHTAEDLEEERRVFHVAVTRARDELYLVVPQVWSNYRKERILMKPSRFLTELEGSGVVETMQLEGDLPHVTAGAEGASL